MKRVLIGVLLASTISLFVACEQDSLLLPSDELITQIASSDAKTEVSVDALPVEIANYIETNYAPLAVESASKVRNLGFEVLLENNYFLYFNENQECLGGGNGSEGHHPRPHRGCMRGDTIDLATLPAAVYDYVAANYPDATIAVAVQKPSGKFGVELSDGTTMIFDAEGVFITLCGQCPGGPPPHHGGCMAGDTVTIAELPQAALDYVAANYPDLTIQTVVVKPIGAFAVELSDGTILLFNPDGVFFRLCGDGPAGPPPPHEGRCMRGDTIDLANLPQAVIDYVAATYPDLTIQTAVVKPDGVFAVELSDGMVLLFDPEGVFIHECDNDGPGGHGGPGGPGGPGGHHGGHGGHGG